MALLATCGLARRQRPAARLLRGPSLFTTGWRQLVQVPFLEPKPQMLIILIWEVKAFMSGPTQWRGGHTTKTMLNVAKTRTGTARVPVHVDAPRRRGAIAPARAAASSGQLARLFMGWQLGRGAHAQPHREGEDGHHNAE